MSLADELTDALVDGYRRTGEEIGYWGHRSLRAVRKDGGVATAKRMLQPRNASQRKGLDALLDANRPDLSIEAIILDPKFRPLFSPAELKEAEKRLGEYGKLLAAQAKKQQLYPDDLPQGRKYPAGARKVVRVNAYERSPQARAACLKHYGFRCAVCNLLFEERYGELGKRFIHVHHVKPLALTTTEYELDPIQDLRPVCPNCHAMLHHGPEGVLSIAELKNRMAEPPPSG